MKYGIKKKKVCFKIFSVEVLLIYNVSGIEQNDSVIYVCIYIYIYIFFFRLFEIQNVKFM